MNGQSDLFRMKDSESRTLKSIYIYTEKFSEAEWHPFRVIKTLVIPGEDEYLLVESRSCNRLLIPARHYQNYGIEANTWIQCRVDRINCSGRIFLEPEHPFYKTGNTYTFRIIERFDTIDRKGRSATRYLVKGDWSHEVNASLKYDEPLPEGILFSGNLIQIRKSVLIMNHIRVVDNC